MMKASQTQVGLTNILTRKKVGERDSSPTEPRRDVALAEDVRRSVTKQSQSATIAYVVTSSAQDTLIKSHGQRTEAPRLHQHYRRKNVCRLLKYLRTTQDVVSATKFIFHIASLFENRIRSQMAVMVLESDLSVLKNTSVNHREFESTLTDQRP